MTSWDQIQFSSLLAKVIPLYLLVLLGFLTGKTLKLPTAPLGSLVVYAIAPFVILQGIWKVDISPGRLLLPLVVYLSSALIALIALKVGKTIWGDSTANLFAAASGTGNTGYFGLPLAVSILGNDGFGVAVLCLLGFVLYEQTLMFYLIARGQYSAIESVRRLVKLTGLHMCWIALVLNVYGVPMPTVIQEYGNKFVGAYSVLGMMIVGIALSQVQITHFDIGFLVMTTISKYIVWPLCVFMLIKLDRMMLQLIDPVSGQVLIIFSCVPLAANTVAFAATLGGQVEKAASTVFANTLLGLVLVPILVGILLTI